MQQVGVWTENERVTHRADLLYREEEQTVGKSVCLTGGGGGGAGRG